MMNLMDKKEFKNKLKTFQAKAGCIYTQRKANSIWNEIKDYLEGKEYDKIMIAWSHYLDCGEGRKELDKVVNDILL